MILLYSMTKNAPEPRQSSWTPERRAAQAAAIRRWSPWAKSTGPKTAAGKARSAQNAAKPYLRVDSHRVMKRALQNHRRHLTEIQRHFRMEKISAQNKLLKRRLKNHYTALTKESLKVMAELQAALIYSQLCKNLAFSPPFPLKVNANDDAKT